MRNSSQKPLQLIIDLSATSCLESTRNRRHFMIEKFKAHLQPKCLRKLHAWPHGECTHDAQVPRELWFPEGTALYVFSTSSMANHLHDSNLDVHVHVSTVNRQTILITVKQLSHAFALMNLRQHLYLSTSRIHQDHVPRQEKSEVMIDHSRDQKELEGRRREDGP
jgi:hypothetical protein